MIARSRTLLARYVPPGAIMLAVLTFAAYGAGLVRDRIFARTYGAGPELDAYNAAFVLPELLLDVLVASGLTAPFVPVFTTLGRDDPDAAPRFAQTVLTLAVAVTAAMSLLLLLAAPWTVHVIAPGFDEVNQARYLDLFRLMLLTPIVFAASIALGEVLVAERHFVYYALAPILYNVGIVLGTVLLHDRIGIAAAAVGAVIGSFLHLGIRLVGMRRTTVRVRFRLDLRMAADPRVPAPDGAQDAQPPDRAADVPVLHPRRDDPRGGQRHRGQLRAELPERARRADRGRDLAGGVPGAVELVGGRRPTGDFSRLVRTSAVTITLTSIVAAIGLVVVAPLAIRVLLGGGKFDADDVALTATVLAAFALSVPFDALGNLLARSLYATHNTVLPLGAAVAGFVVTVATTLVLVDRVGIVAIPLGLRGGLRRPDGAPGHRARRGGCGRVRPRRRRRRSPPEAPARSRSSASSASRSAAWSARRR